MTACSGEGRKWTTGTGIPVCPVCHRGWRGLGLERKPRPRVDTLPPHDNGRTPSAPPTSGSTR